MKLRAPEYIVMFLILMVTCSTYYLHWTHGPESHDHEKYRFRKHVNVEAHQDVSEAAKEPPMLRKQPVSTTHFAAPKEVPAETIVVAVPTHNRIGYVQLTSAALKGTFPAEDIWIFDDKSSEYSTDDLLEWYGTEHVWQSTKRMKADAMARHILEWFLKTKYDVLVLLDSDLLVSPNWLPKLRDGLRQSTGLLSLYRSGAPKHKSSSCDAVLCRMPSMGNAGTVWRRALVTKMLSEIPNRDGGFDWGWSEWCAKNKVPMEALKESAVLHIGMHGSWSHETSAEKSVGFPMGELSVDVRQQAEHFLKGAKPTESTNKKLPNHYDKVSIGEVPDILWVIPAFKRAWSLDLVLKSLASQNNILVSKDADSDEIDSVLKKYSADVISHPWSCSRHPNQFPAKDESLNENYKGDTYGNPRSPWATCLKHHWWWMMKQAWARKPERVCVLEDDTVIHPQAFEWLASHSGNVKLTPEEIAVPWCMSAKEWQTIEPKAFCEHDDYNWDQTIAWMKEHGHGPNEASVPSVSLSMHVGDCGGWDAGGRDKACTPQKIVKIHANVEHWLGKSIPVHIVKRKWLTAHSKPNGGWGHPKDWAHCLGNDESKPFGMHFLERLEYYLPNRDYLFPTDVKSIEKKILTFDIPNHVSITFDAPVENIAISTKNWPEKHKTQCPNCEFVNDRSATVKWVPGCPSNPRKDYKEQILVCSCGESQKGTGSSYFNSGIHKCDYDASFLNHDFQDAYSHLHLTPPQYKKILTVSNEMERYLEMPPMQEDKAVFIHSDCGHERGTFVSKMIQEGIIPIDRYGKCWRNKDIKTIEPPREKWYWGDSQGNRDTTKTDVFTGYKFSFALENTKSRDYFTEKRYQSFLALTVPIVWKNDNSEQYTPGENSVIYPEDHDNDPTELAKYLLRLTTDDKAYQKHMAWKKKGIRREFVKTLFKKTDFMACRICEKVSARKVSTSSKKYVVVMPSVKRNNDEYLIKTLDSLEKAKPADVSVLHVNANQPVEEHTYLREWCSSHEKYKCINPPKVPESLIKDAISNDKRGDSEHFLRWRTTETEHALFGLREALKLHTEYIIWMQDDVIVNKDLFASLVNDDIVCLRDGNDYCGAVAYLFSRKFVEELIPKIEANKLTMPIDWIIFDPRPPEAKYNVPKRIPLITHVGKKSSKHIRRPSSQVHKRSCSWNPENNNGIVIDYTGNEECIKTLPKIANKRVLFLGDSTMWRLFTHSSIHQCPAQKVMRSSRCRWIEDFGMTRLPVWTPPEAKMEGPVDYGKTHPFCTDCSGCSSEFRTGVTNTDSCVQQNYIAVEFARDVEMQTTVGKTTQESLSYFLGKHEQHDICIVNTGMHDMAIRNITDQTFVQNMGWYFNILKRNCQKIVWIELTDVATQTYFQTTPRLKKWNDMIFEKTKEFDYVWVVRLFDASKSIKHLDNAHMHSSWYSALNKMLFKAIEHNTPRSLTLCELIPMICKCGSQKQQTRTLENIFAILTFNKVQIFSKNMYPTKTNIHGHELMLFAPKDDIGLKTVIAEQKKDEYRLRQWNLKAEDLFVDVGSNLGVVSILAALQYPDIRILSIEASPPTWFYQQLNLLCNIPSYQTIKSVCVGLGKTDGTMKMMYRPSSTTSTRNWNPISEYNPSEDIEFDVHISSLDTVLGETSNQYPISMMKLDCEGCEYEFLPYLSGQAKIKDMVGEVHYGFMAQFNKEPSAEKIISTHRHVCSYSYFKDIAKECCYFVKSNDKLCNDYTTWAEKNRLVLYQTNTPTIKNTQTIIQTSDLFANIDYNAPENKGPWKQGWDYEYDGRFKDGLTVHVVPHSHNDPGWIKTYHTYYSTQTKHILDTVVAALTEDPRRTFIWAEISYFSLWWDDASSEQKEQAKKLVAEKRLDFVTGGWVMNDEASVTARATRWHLQEGREWLQKTFGITPQYSWAIDPFGHSAGQAQVLKELGYKGMLIQRVHYAVKKQLAEKQQLEFQWQTPAGEIFTHMMPFYSYDGPHTCGPDPSVCCQFDFARIGGGYSGCPWHKPSVPITDSNVAERSRTWLDQVYKKAMLYRGKNVLIPVGDDFRYQTMDEAHKQFTNYQRMFDWIGVHLPSVKVSFSTLTRYFDAVRVPAVVLPRLEGSFFPYSDRKQDYWTGYFNSRIFYKGYDRLLESLIAAVETKCPTVDIHLQKRALGLFQHHDGITGTAKSHVVQDYYQTMQKAVTELKLKLKTCLDIAGYVLVNPLSVDTPTMKADEIRPYEEDACVSVPAAGLQFENIKVDGHGRLVQINDTPVHESLVWRSNKPGQGVAGAYLMSVTPKEDMLQPIKHTTCIAKMYKQLETTFDLLKRRIRVYNDGTIEFIYDVDIHARNNGELWAMYKPEWTAERLCSDVHGLTWECHVERKDAPLQAKFWPMPTMAWLASSSDRMTWTGAQPTGVGFHDGALVLMLDRRGNQDDARGLGQGITDSRPVEMRFGVLMETEGLKERATEKALTIRNWMLNPEIEIV